MITQTGPKKLRIGREEMSGVALLFDHGRTVADALLEQFHYVDHEASALELASAAFVEVGMLTRIVYWGRVA